jgi:MFS-type transporter involved in bile tolerance (Atg22 family)
MIIFRIFIFLLSCLFLIAGLTTILSPNVNNIFLPLEVTDQATSILLRPFGGFVAAIGYLSMRFLYSSSKVQVGTVVLYIVLVMILAKLFSFFYDGYTNFSFATFAIAIIFALSLFFVQRSRKNQISDQNFLN